jgi:hypothetical protein
VSLILVNNYAISLFLTSWEFDIIRVFYISLAQFRVSLNWMKTDHHALIPLHNMKICSGWELWECYELQAGNCQLHMHTAYSLGKNPLFSLRWSGSCSPGVGEGKYSLPLSEGCRQQFHSCSQLKITAYGWQLVTCLEVRAHIFITNRSIKND